MSARPAAVSVSPRLERAVPARYDPDSPVVTHAIRWGAFSALALYGALRWATLLHPGQSGRLLGLVALAAALGVIVPAARRWGLPPAIAAAVALALLALPVAGLPWHDFAYLKLAASAREIGHGLSALPGSYVPYTGTSPAVRLVIVLGAAVLLLDAAVVLVFASRTAGDGRRAAAALPLVALAVVPSTLLRPGLPYLQGLILFALVVAFVWGERLRREGGAALLLLLLVAGVAGGMLAPSLDQHQPWLDYRAWTGTLARSRLDAFEWNQRYGPLHWPRTGHTVMTVAATRADYWKAEDLDVFNGYGWVAGPVDSSPLPQPSPAAIARWSQTIGVRVTGMRSDAIIAAGYAAAPSLVAGGVIPGDGAGTWVAGRPLGPGVSYTVRTYSPHPSPAALARAGNQYPDVLAAYRTLTLPVRGLPAVDLPQVEFARFGSRAAPAVVAGGSGTEGSRLLRASAYAPVYALARRLARRTSTPYGYAAAVRHYLARGYAYRENPPARRYPLVSFLFADRRGYCQQFSGAMAMLLRMGGVPARVAAGFTSGAPATDGQWIVSDMDAHAWVEAWFPHYGWVRFDPTPVAAPARGGQATAPVVKDLPGANVAASRNPRLSAPTPVAPRGHRTPTAAGPSPWLLLPAGAAGVLLLLALVAALRPRRGVETRMHELERALARTGRPLGPEVTLAVLERRFHDSPAAAGYVRTLRLARYAGRSDISVPGGRGAVRAQLRQGLGATGRLRALWALPPRPALGSRRRSRPLGPESRV
ncbi:MAG: transglutaminase-like domain-containing protein [Actinomycetota bacterium]|nr:transglutaminase-like domain-containing protein [Actinomycetota bacterium]